MTKRFAIPIENNVLCAHFGYAKEFVFIDAIDGNIMDEKHFKPSPHEPGSLPKWISQMGATAVLAGGLGQQAIAIMKAHHIEVHTGVKVKVLKTLVEDLLNKDLELGGHECDHPQIINHCYMSIIGDTIAKGQ